MLGAATYVGLPLYSHFLTRAGGSSTRLRWNYTPAGLSYLQLFGDKLMIRIFSAGLLCIALTGCFDVEQRFAVQDTDATYDINVVVDSAFLQKLEDWSDKDFCNIQFDDLAEELPESISRSINQKVDEDGLHCGASYTGPLEIMKGLALTKRFEQGSQVFNLREVGPNRMRLESVYEGAEVNKAQEEVPQFIRNMIAAAFRDSHLVWRIEVPRVVSTNGVLSDDRKQVEWRLSLEELIQSDEHVFFVEFSTNPSGAIDI